MFQLISTKFWCTTYGKIMVRNSEVDGLLLAMDKEEVFMQCMHLHTVKYIAKINYLYNVEFQFYLYHLLKGSSSSCLQHGLKAPHTSVHLYKKFRI